MADVLLPIQEVTSARLIRDAAQLWRNPWHRRVLEERFVDRLPLRRRLQVVFAMAALAAIQADNVVVPFTAGQIADELNRRHAHTKVARAVRKASPRP